MMIPFARRTPPSINVDTMIAVDRAMIDDFHIQLIQMMENAGRTLALLASHRFLNGNASGKHITILAGSGGNGGGALVCARRLHIWGARINAFLSRPLDQLKPVTAHQARILEKMGVRLHTAEQCQIPIHTDLVIDGIIGYNLTGPPQGTASYLIASANETSAPILSLDIPSGMNASSGQVYQPAISAQATLTLALLKNGLMVEGASTATGELYLADISVPPELYRQLGLNIEPLFDESEIIRIR